MVKIAYLLLCHKNVEGVAAQARALAEAGDAVAIHFDKRGGAADFAALKRALGDHPSVAFARRVACGWGEYSLVQAALNALDAARGAFEGVTHYFLISADCLPIKSAAHIHGRLAAEDRDYIEINDFLDSGWIKTGLKEERLTYRHFFNERKRKRLFYASLEAQKRLGLRRKPPEDLRIKIGSQWWLLRASTVERMLAYMRRRRDVARFFRTTWIPDETMFQTIAHHCAPRGEIASHPPTALIFTDYGIPQVFCADHEELLLRENRFFARKITAHDADFRARLLDRYVNGDGSEEAGEEGIAPHYAYLSRRGREGRREAPRFWRSAIEIGPDRELFIVACKKWHVGAGIADAVGRIAGAPAFGYVFDQDEPLDVDLGGLEAGKAKRDRHRRAFLNILFDQTGSDRLAICVDPARADVVRDFGATECRMRVLSVETPFEEADYAAHAERVGLMRADAGPARRAAIVAAVRAEFEEEREALRRADRGRVHRVVAGQGRAENAVAVARFLAAGAAEVEALTREIEPHL